MKSLLSRRPSPALVIACLALFVSLSGVSYGVATGFIDSREIKNNEVRTKDLRNNDIRTRDLRNNEIRGIDIRNSTIQGRDIGINQVTGTDVRESTLQKVPSATAADSATTAASAATADNMRAIPLTTLPEGGVRRGPSDPRAAHRERCLSARRGRDQAVHTRRHHGGELGRRRPRQQLPRARSRRRPRGGFLHRDLAATPRNIGQDTFVAWAPSGKALSGVLSLTADASGAGSCKVHGQIGLQG